MKIACDFEYNPETYEILGCSFYDGKVGEYLKTKKEIVDKFDWIHYNLSLIHI